MSQVAPPSTHNPEPRIGRAARRPPGSGEDLSQASARTRTAARITLILSLAGFAALATAVAFTDGPFAIDTGLAEWVAQHRSASLTSWMQVVTFGGSDPVVLGILILASAWGVARRNLRPAGFIAVTTTLAWFAVRTLKLLFARPRPGPMLSVGTFSEYAFPSGHATTAAALWGTLAWLLGRRGPKRVQAGCLAMWALAILMVDASRIELGAHWLTDVVGGTLLGTICLSVVVLLADLPSRVILMATRDSPGRHKSRR